MQDPRASTELAGFCREVHNAVREALAKPPPSLNVAMVEPPQTLAAFYQFLEQTNRALAQAKERLILALDEHENLDRKLWGGGVSH
ncbi:MAG TPA: hypothetical protein VIV60_20160 [Polyangiaceae bacterium]